MSRFITTLGALGLSLAATTAFAHGGSSHGSMGGFEQPVTFTGPQGVSTMGKVAALTGRDSIRDRREFTERQVRIQEEIKRLEEDKVRLIRELGPLDHFRSLEALERAKRDILQIDEKIGRLQGEERGATLTIAR